MLDKLPVMGSIEIGIGHAARFFRDGDVAIYQHRMPVGNDARKLEILPLRRAPAPHR